MVACFLIEREKSLLDDLVTMHHTYLIDLERKSRKLLKERYYEARRNQRKSVGTVMTYREGAPERRWRWNHRRVPEGPRPRGRRLVIPGRHGVLDTGVEPDCGVKVRPVIVTVKESTPQKGVSPPKMASVPGVVTMCVVVPGSPGPLQPPRRPAAATNAIASMYFFIGRYLPAEGRREGRRRSA